MTGPQGGMPRYQGQGPMDGNGNYYPMQLAQQPQPGSVADLLYAQFCAQMQRCLDGLLRAVTHLIQDKANESQLRLRPTCPRRSSSSRR